MSKPELIIHIGSHKTGSTSLQEGFINNRILLKEERIFYPTSEAYNTFGKEIEDYIFKESVAKILKKDRNIQMKYKRKIDNKIKKMLKKYRKGSYKKILISSETFFFRSSHPILRDRTLTPLQVKKINEGYFDRILRLKELFVEFDVKIVCYLRRQDLFVESLYNQICKDGRYKKIEALTDRYYYGFKEEHNSNFLTNQMTENGFELMYKFLFLSTFYYDIITTWSKIFGKPNIKVIVFEKNQLDTGLVKDFFINILNIEREKLVFLKDHHINERINRDILEYINKLERRHKYCYPEDLILISGKISETDRYKSYLTIAQRKELLNYHETDNQKIAKEYLGREDGILFYEDVEKMGHECYPGLTTEKIILLDKEFNEISRRTYIYVIKMTFRKAKSYVESEFLPNEETDYIKKFKVQVCIVGIFSKQVIGKVVRRVFGR